MNSEDQIAREVEDVKVEDEMEQSYIDYAMSVIAGRALPDVRDGLKPVQRRLLYAMKEEGVTSRKSHRKSSSVVGTTMGNYHPHGDKAIYDALVRLAQPFSMRHPLVDGQGNFGSIDDDPPAAMRYTEARMTPLAEEMLQEIDQDTVDFQSNYDDRLEEPEVLPAPFPNVLVNGSSGIAVGMSTKIPPHNLGEVVDATIHLLDNPDATVEHLMDYVKGPDFPTGAKVMGREEVKKAYETGKGKLRVRAKSHIERRDDGRDQIVITEIPYEMKKSRIVEKIADKASDGELGGVSGLRDETDKEGLRITVDLKRDAIPEVVHNRLIDSVLEKTFGVINLALVDGTPTVMNLKEMLSEFIEFRTDCVRRRTRKSLQEETERAHMLEGKIVAVENAEDVVDTIRESEDRETAIEVLQENFGLSEAQASHVVRMQLGSLTSMEEENIREEFESVQDRIETLSNRLESESLIRDVIREELENIKDKFAKERKTEIVSQASSVSDEDLIPEEERLYFLTEGGYSKSTPTSEFRIQKRGGRGMKGIELRNDLVSLLTSHQTHQTLLPVTADGKVYEFRGHQLPSSGRQARGRPVVSYIDDVEVTSIATLKEGVQEEDDYYLLFATSDGLVKRTPLSEYENIRSSGIRAINLNEGDEVIDTCLVQDDDQLILSSSKGRAIRFEVSEVSPSGRNAQGVMGMSLEQEESLVSAEVVADDSYLLTVTENGYGKMTPVASYKLQNRYGKGVLDISTGSRNGDAVGSVAVDGTEDIFLSTGDGRIIGIDVNEVPERGRNTKGVKLVDCAEDERVVDLDTQ